jgi:hypothetical protein
MTLGEVELIVKDIENNLGNQTPIFSNKHLEAYSRSLIERLLALKTI